MPNKTAQDAYNRVLQAKIGSVVDATPEYLQTLRTYVAQWVEQIDKHIAETRRLQGNNAEWEQSAHGYYPDALARAHKAALSDTCNCGAQDKAEHDPHDPNCNVYKH
jgi:hypothetical protein